MRIKTFTLMTLALLVSAVSFAQKPKALAPQAFSQQFSHQKGAMQQPAMRMDGEFSHQVTMGAVSFAAEVVTPPANSEPEYFTASGLHSRNNNATLERTVKVIWDGDDVYISGLSYFIPDAYVKGTFTDDETVVFEKDQYLGTYAFSNGNAELYFGAYNTTTRASDNATATYDGEANKFTFSGLISEFYHLDGATGLTAYWSNLTVSKIEGEIDLPVEIPTNLEYEKYSFVGINPWADEGEDPTVSRNVNVGFYGNEVYIQGLSSYLPNAWVKGEIDEDGDIVFPSGQLLGTYNNRYEMWFIGYTSSGIMDVWFEYDQEEGKLTCHVPYAINNYKDEINRSVFEYYGDVVISKIVERSATPANPSFTNMEFDPSGEYLGFALNTVDTEGNGLLTEKLSYKLYYNDEYGNPQPVLFTKDLYETLSEDTETIPYEFTDNKYFEEGYVFLKMEHEGWEKVGLQSIYTGGDETHESEIVWYTIAWPEEQVTLPEGLTTTEHQFEGTDQNDEEFSETVKIATSGDDLYIQGLCYYLPDAWVKGTKTDAETYVFAANQDLGISTRYACRVFATGYGDKVEDFVLKVDSKNGLYILENDWVMNTTYTDRLYYLEYFNAGSTITIDAVGTAISTVKSDAKANAAAIYNLAGQRVSDGFKGLVIKNGKKMVVK